MINYFYNKIKGSVKESYKKSLDKLNLKKTACPNCQARGQFKNHGHYSRHVIVLLGAQVTHEVIEVKRVKCKSCNRTHALLPSFILPYHTHTYSVILKCLDEKIVQKKKIKELTDLMGISFQLLFNWIKRFKSQHTESYLVFERGFLSLTDCLVAILTDRFWFLARYFDEHRYSFMQIN